MKLTILGGGGFRVPSVYRAIGTDTGTPRIDDLALYDPSVERLNVIGSVIEQQEKSLRQPPRVTSFTDLDAALSGSDFVFVAIRVGGLLARIHDERVALDLGVLGQETTGPGGIAYGLRTVPIALKIADAVSRVCPDAYVINFTNPAGIITEAMAETLGDRVIGVCDSPRGLGRRLAGALNLEPERVEFDYIGLNHLGWMRRVMYDGQDYLPRLLTDDVALSTLVEARVFGVAWLRALGSIPNEYLYYYYCNRDAISAIRAQSETRGEFLFRQQTDFYSAAVAHPDRAYEIWHRTKAERNALYMAEARGDYLARSGPAPSKHDGGGYEGVARSVITAIARDERTTMILNVRNRGALTGFDADAIIEIPCMVDAAGAHSIPTGPVGLHQLGLMQEVKAVERLTIEAARSGSAQTALKAFALHPLVDSLSVAGALLRGYIDAVPEIASVLGAGVSTVY